MSQQPPPMMGAHLQTWIDGKITEPEIDVRPGDSLTLTLHYLSGAQPFQVIETTLTIP